ncbi:MAG: nuclear transport factor 2 family protein [Actinomycetota bacterium]
MSQENIELSRRVFAELARANELDEVERTDAALEEFFDPDVEWVPVPQGLLAGSTYQGYEGIRRFWADFVSAWDEYLMEPQEFLDAGDQVVVIVRVRGRMHKLEINEVWSVLNTFRDGRIVRVQGFTSRDGALEAAGLRE